MAIPATNNLPDPRSTTPRPCRPTGGWRMTMLDQNRAKTQLARKRRGGLSRAVHQLAIWGKSQHHDVIRLPQREESEAGPRGSHQGEGVVQGHFHFPRCRGAAPRHRGRGPARPLPLPMPWSTPSGGITIPTPTAIIQHRRSRRTAPMGIRTRTDLTPSPSEATARSGRWFQACRLVNSAAANSLRPRTN